MAVPDLPVTVFTMVFFSENKYPILHAGDVYGLGCCLYEMLLGERFGRTRPSLEKHLDRMRKALHRAWDHLEEELQEPVLALLGEMLAYDHWFGLTQSKWPPARWSFADMRRVPP